MPVRANFLATTVNLTHIFPPILLQPRRAILIVCFILTYIQPRRIYAAVSLLLVHALEDSCIVASY